MGSNPTSETDGTVKQRIKDTMVTLVVHFVPVAQRIRAPRYERGGWGFESLPGRLHAGVAEWQTRQAQTLVIARS